MSAEHIDLTTPCVEWTGRTDGWGYGRLGEKYVHRTAYEKAFGPIPKGLTIDHLCRNRICINPLHLEAVTNRENVLRGESYTAVNARKTHCSKGHPFDEANTYMSPAWDRRGRRRYSRQCRICNRAYVAARKARLQA